MRACLLCLTPFEPNEELEHLPRGHRLAFDPERGRLWVVCRACHRWSLLPLEDRWEALEELEKATVDRGHLLSQTENISLLRIGPLEVVRVGRARLGEEAWWRYGRELKARREGSKKVAVGATAATGALMMGGMWTGGLTVVGMWFLWSHGPRTVTDTVRWMRFGGKAWRGEHRCISCGYLFRDFAYKDRGAIALVPGEGARRPDLTVPCPRCRGWGDEGGLTMKGTEAEGTLRRVLAYHHHDGASERRVQAATRLIEEAGSPEDLTRILVRRGRRLGDIQRTGAIALEIAANESREQHLLELELRELEAVWRREEELAAIIDGELTPLGRLRKLKAGLLGGGTRE